MEHLICDLRLTVFVGRFSMAIGNDLPIPSQCSKWQVIRSGLLIVVALTVLSGGINIVGAETYFCFNNPTLDPIRITLGQSSTLSVTVCNVGDAASVTIKVSSVSGPPMNIQPRDSISFQMDWGQWPAPLPNHQEFFLLTPTAIGICYGRLELYRNNNLVNSLEFKLTVDPPSTQNQNQGFSAVTSVVTSVSAVTVTGSTPVVINFNFEVFGLSAVSISLVAILSFALWKRVAKNSNS